MVNVTPYDNISEVDCRFQIENWGLVFGKDLDKELKKYFKEHEVK